MWSSERNRKGRGGTYEEMQRNLRFRHVRFPGVKGEIDARVHT